MAVEKFPTCFNCWSPAYRWSGQYHNLWSINLTQFVTIVPLNTIKFNTKYDNSKTFKKRLVLKIYKDGSLIDLAKAEKIDKGLTAQNLRYPVYNYVHLAKSTDPEWPKTTAKFEEFLSDRKDFKNVPIEPKEARLEIAKRLGKLHSATDIEGLVSK